MKTKIYKGFIFKYAYRQWVTTLSGSEAGFYTWEEATRYIDAILKKKEVKK